MYIYFDLDEPLSLVALLNETKCVNILMQTLWSAVVHLRSDSQMYDKLVCMYHLISKASTRIILVNSINQSTITPYTCIELRLREHEASSLIYEELEIL